MRKVENTNRKCFPAQDLQIKVNISILPLLIPGLLEELQQTKLFGFPHQLQGDPKNCHLVIQDSWIS